MGAWQEIADVVVATVTDSITIDLSATPIQKGEFWKVEFTGKSAANTESGIYLEINNLTNDTDYYGQFLIGDNTSAFAGRRTNRQLGNLGGAETHGIMYFVVSENNYGNVFLSQNNVKTTNEPTVQFRYQTTASTITSMTQLRFFAVADSFAVGTRIQIYKLAAEKVADITVASNTTQVDISNLSIDKDSEYLLVSDVSNPTGSQTSIYMTPNDLTTPTGYYGQQVLGSGSTAGGFRANNPFLAVLNASTTSTLYSHIKLSNIGAYTFQAYELRNMGTSSLEVRNNFISSIAENITSITKLNIVSTNTSGIAAGSRFTLYKLY